MTNPHYTLNAEAPQTWLAPPSRPGLSIRLSLSSKSSRMTLLGGPTPSECWALFNDLWRLLVFENPNCNSLRASQGMLLPGVIEGPRIAVLATCLQQSGWDVEVHDVEAPPTAE